MSWDFSLGYYGHFSLLQIEFLNNFEIKKVFKVKWQTLQNLNRIQVKTISEFSGFTCNHGYCSKQTKRFVWASFLLPVERSRLQSSLLHVRSFTVWNSTDCRSVPKAFSISSWKRFQTETFDLKSLIHRSKWAFCGTEFVLSRRHFITVAFPEDFRVWKDIEVTLGGQSK